MTSAVHRDDRAGDASWILYIGLNDAKRYCMKCEQL